MIASVIEVLSVTNGLIPLMAIPILERLEEEANYPQNIVFAQSNLMKGYYENKNYFYTY